MRPEELILRCYSEREDNAWVAVCIDLSLAAQAETMEEARQKLDQQIRELVFDAMAGEDRSHAPSLFTRKAPLKYRAKYWFFAVRERVSGVLGLPVRKARFAESVPLVPALC